MPPGALRAADGAAFATLVVTGPNAFRGADGDELLVETGGPVTASPEPKWLVFARAFVVVDDPFETEFWFGEPNELLDPTPGFANDGGEELI
jgi:hypothetical protein